MDWTEKAREFLEQHKFVQAAHIAELCAEVERETLERAAKIICPLCDGKVPSDIEVKPQVAGVHELISKYEYHPPFRRDCHAYEILSLASGGEGRVRE